MSEQKIIPHLWFDKEAKEAAEFYTSIFPNSKITSTTELHDTPSGDTDIVAFELSNFKFLSISAGPLFKFNPSVSFMLNFDPSRDPEAEKHLNEMWDKLSDGGTALMEIGEYPFSKRFGWIQDKYGISWQLILTDPDGEERPFIIPAIMFVGDVAGKAEEAINFYVNTFKNSKLGMIARYGAGQEPEKEGEILFSEFMIEGQWFVANDSRQDHKFAFNEAISLLVNCNNQEEIDYYWDKLSAVPEAEQCGWLKDKFGLSWQISPANMDGMMKNGTKEQVDRVTQAFLKMKKFDVAELERAFEGNSL